MYLKTSALLFSVILSMCTSRGYQKFNSNRLFRTKNNKDGNTQSCFCFDNPESNTLVPQILDPEKNGLERLVVYLYKDPNTKTLKFYTPSKEKQYLIPDIAFEHGDSLLTIKNETVNNIFDMNPNIVELNANKQDIEKENNPGTDAIDPFQGIITHDIGIDTSVLESEENATDIFNNKLPDDNNRPNVNSYGITPEAHYKKHTHQNWAVPGHKSHIWHGYGNKYTYNPNAFNYQDNVKRESFVTFDDWFGQQMQTFHQLEAHGDINFVKDDKLKTLVMKTLAENSMFVRTDGVLTDSRGHVLNMSNLKLRPVLIGDSITYEKFLQKTGQKSSLARDLSYLQTLMVTLVYPPKILGIIPLGKTYLPPIPSSSANPETVPNTTTVKKTHCNGGNKCYSQKIYRPTHFLAQHIGPIENRIIPGRLDTQKTHRYKPSETTSMNRMAGKAKTNIDNIEKDDYEVKTEPKYASDEIGLEETRRFLLGDMLKTLLSFMPQKEESETMTTEFYPIYGEMIPETEQIFDEENYIEEDRVDVPDFRIIGGNAATSSGTPVSNRGRSGIIF